MSNNTVEEAARLKRARQEVFGFVLKRWREDQGKSQGTLAFDVDVDRSYISLLERGERCPSLNTIFLLAEALGTTPAVLVEKCEDLLRPVR